VRLAVVVQRYGADINGGAELHARYIAEHLAPHASVEVLTTCARDYITWRNELPAGVEDINGLAVRRFPVSRERDVTDFGRRSAQVFERTHSLNDELAWLESEGPTSPALVEYARTHRDEFDYFILFSYRYYHAYRIARALGSQSILVPTAERDPAIGLSLFGPVFRGVRALMYNSPEERAMIHGVSGNDAVPGVVVGIGSNVPTTADPLRFRKTFGVPDRFMLYVGRIDENKGCKELFDFVIRYNARERAGLTLVLVGQAVMPVPAHPRIRHVGFLDDDDKFDALAAAEFLVMPSYFESLSMVAIEAWGMGRPVLANAKCDVLQGQCLRSNAGLYYESYEEFAEALHVLMANRELTDALGRNGRAFFARHYSWPVIERAYLDMLRQLEGAPAGAVSTPDADTLPGWFARRRRILPPGREPLDRVASGPVRPALLDTGPGSQPTRSGRGRRR
jgi:glycosyltransferase involved in cell wall biosynthesis